MEHFKFEIEKEKEERTETMKYINSKRNWDIENQRYRIPPKEEYKIKRTTNLSECRIYWRGKYLILEHNDMVHYWESLPECFLTQTCFLKQAVEFMELEKPAKWKTIDKLLSLRHGIRQTEVNLCGYVDAILEGEKMTLKLHRKFMSLARAQDLQHHGQHTF